MTGIAIVGLAGSAAALLAGVAVAGIALGPLAPTLISVAGDRYPKRTGLAIGAVISLGQIGGVTLPWITGRTAIAVGFRGAMLVPMAASLAILAGAVTLRVRQRPMILFDLDGTLVDTTDLILRSFRHAFDRHLPGQLPPREDIVATFGTSLPGVLTEMAAAGGHEAPEQMGAELLTTYREFQHQHHDTLVQPFPGIPEMLTALKADGHRLGLVTSKMEGFARRGLRLVGLESFLEVMVFHDDTERHKPDPEPLLFAASRAGERPRGRDLRRRLHARRRGGPRGRDANGCGAVGAVRAGGAGRGEAGLHHCHAGGAAAARGEIAPV